MTRMSRTSRSVSHHSPGRTRIKVPKSQRHNLHQLKENLSNHPDVQDVEINHDTGSVLVKHAHEAPIFEILHSAVETVGTDLLTTLIEGETASLLGPATIVATGAGIIATVGKSFFRRRMSAAGEQSSEGSSIPFADASPDLKTLIPAGFVAAALYKAWETETFWTGVTPLALIYWAFDTYWKLNISSDLAKFEEEQAKRLVVKQQGNGHDPIEKNLSN